MPPASAFKSKRYDAVLKRGVSRHALTLTHIKRIAPMIVIKAQKKE